jgi:hypothetical protein
MIPLDKLAHLFVGIALALLFVFGRMGLFIGWAIIIGWEVWQAGSGTGTPEVADILWGGIPFTIVWFIAYTYFKKKK